MAPQTGVLTCMGKSSFMKSKQLNRTSPCPGYDSITSPIYLPSYEHSLLPTGTAYWVCSTQENTRRRTIPDEYPFSMVYFPGKGYFLESVPQSRSGLKAKGSLAYWVWGLAQACKVQNYSQSVSFAWVVEALISKPQAPQQIRDPNLMPLGSRKHRLAKVPSSRLLAFASSRLSSLRPAQAEGSSPISSCYFQSTMQLTAMMGLSSYLDK